MKKFRTDFHPDFNNEKVNKKEKELLDRLKRFSVAVERAIHELQLCEDIRDIKVKYGEYCPEFNAHILNIEAIGKVIRTEKRMAYMKMIQRFN
jgi:hypothetical protein